MLRNTFTGCFLFVFMLFSMDGFGLATQSLLNESNLESRLQNTDLSRVYQDKKSTQIGNEGGDMNLLDDAALLPMVLAFLEPNQIENILPHLPKHVRKVIETQRKNARARLQNSLSAPTPGVIDGNVKALFDDEGSYAQAYAFDLLSYVMGGAKIRTNSDGVKEVLITNINTDMVKPIEYLVQYAATYSIYTDMHLATTWKQKIVKLFNETKMELFNEKSGKKPLRPYKIVFDQQLFYQLKALCPNYWEKLKRIRNSHNIPIIDEYDQIQDKKGMAGRLLPKFFPYWKKQLDANEYQTLEKFSAAYFHLKSLNTTHALAHDIYKAFSYFNEQKQPFVYLNAQDVNTGNTIMHLWMGKYIRAGQKTRERDYDEYFPQLLAHEKIEGFNWLKRNKKDRTPIELLFQTGRFNSFIKRPLIAIGLNFFLFGGLCVLYGLSVISVSFWVIVAIMGGGQLYFWVSSLVARILRGPWDGAAKGGKLSKVEAMILAKTVTQALKENPLGVNDMLSRLSNSTHAAIIFDYLVENKLIAKEVLAPFHQRKPNIDIFSAITLYAVTGFIVITLSCLFTTGFCSITSIVFILLIISLIPIGGLLFVMQQKTWVSSDANKKEVLFSALLYNISNKTQHAIDSILNHDATLLFDSRLWRMFLDKLEAPSSHQFMSDVEPDVSTQLLLPNQIQTGSNNHIRTGVADAFFHTFLKEKLRDATKRLAARPKAYGKIYKTINRDATFSGLVSLLPAPKDRALSDKNIKQIVSVLDQLIDELSSAFMQGGQQTISLDAGLITGQNSIAIEDGIRFFDLIYTQA